MHNNIYIDTNIVIDISDSARENHEASFTYVIECFKEKRCELFINSDTLSTLFYILSNRSTLTKVEVLEKMRFVNEIFTLVVIESEDVLSALNLCEEDTTRYNDYEDAMQYICAKKVDADVIVTNDKNFIAEDIKIVKTKQ